MTNLDIAITKLSEAVDLLLQMDHGEERYAHEINDLEEIISILSEESLDAKGL
jgi:hypothetical protein